MLLMMRAVNAKNMTFFEGKLDELLEVAQEGFLVDFSRCASEVDLVSARSSAGDSLLHVACARGNLEEVKILCQLGAKINLKGDYGYSALHYAAEAGSEEVYNFLISKGANEDERNIYDDKPQDLFFLKTEKTEKEGRRAKRRLF